MLRLNLFYNKEGCLTLNDMSKTNFKTLKPTSCTHHTILMNVWKKTDVVKLVEGDISFSPWHCCSILKSPRTVLYG